MRSRLSPSGNHEQKAVIEMIQEYSANLDTRATNGSRRGPSTPVLIIGAGPAGLTAAYELSKSDVASIVVEADNTVGGISRTVDYKGYHFDIGGHRFFTKVSLVEQMWRDVLGDDFLSRPRLSRIYYKNKFFQYPLQPIDALLGLGIFQSLRCGLSYAWARLFPQRPEKSFEAWVCNRFGRRLFETFFKSYTEKVWGMKCSEIGAEWAAQRIRGLSLISVVVNSLKFLKPKNKNKVIKTLLHEFHYPRLGPGMMWRRTKEIVESRGSQIKFNSAVEKIRWEPGRVISVVAGGTEYRADHFISSMPIRDLIRCLDPAPPAELLAAASDFNYRDFLTVSLMCQGSGLFPDNWIYIHDPNVKVGRIQNFGNWSPEMVPNKDTTCLGMEYFCFEGDDLWEMKDADLLQMAKREIGYLKLVKPESVFDGAVVRIPKAYPVYDDTYKRGIEAIQAFLKDVPNLQLVGRNGMHKYNNQDHSMLTAILAARNILGSRYDLWRVNVDEEYSEEGGPINEETLRALETTQPLVPRAISATD
jgi:protoporphyrinogen oxidase